MRPVFLFSLFCAFAIVGAASASECGSRGNGDLLTLEEWSAEADAFGANVLLRLTNQGPAAIRMVDATVGFEDQLGAEVGIWALDRDISIPPGESVETRISTFEARLANGARLSMIGTVCVHAAVFGDGTKVVY